MTKTLSLNTQKRIAIFVAAVAIFFGMFTFVPKVQAESDMEAMQAQIAQLLQMVSILQAQLATMNTTSVSSEVDSVNSSISVGDRVKTTDMLKVRAGAGITENWVNNVAAFTGGKVVNGPRYANGYTWWHITYDSGTSGWSAQNWLRIADSVSKESIETVNQKKDLKESRIVSFNRIIPIEGPISVKWSTVGVLDCSIYHAGAQKGVYAENVGPSGEREVSLDFTHGSDIVTYELRCLSSSTDSTVNAFTEIDRFSDDMKLRTQQLNKEFSESWNQAFSIDYEDRADKDIESAAEALIEHEERFEDIADEAADAGFTEEIQILLKKTEDYLSDARAEYNKEAYEDAVDSAKNADDALDELNNILDDIEDGRY